MIDPHILKQIRRIQITTKRLVSNVFAGEYKSVFKGRGYEFDQVREYQIGDEVRMIDWNVTARTGRAFVKQYIEERELTVMILFDASASTGFGSVNMLKRDMAAEICSILAGSAIENNDRVGLLIFTDRVERFIPPKKGTNHIFRIIREALYTEPKGTGTDIKLALEYLNKVIPKTCTIFLISDFYAGEFKKALTVTAKRHDVVAINISDPRDISLPDVGMVRFRCPEDGKTFTLDTSDEQLRNEYTGRTNTRLAELKNLFGSISVDLITLNTAEPYMNSLINFFATRKIKKG
ncbi:MAG TPA: DUF58 domain-containing protein [Candidatus Omnitrophota bacterium]|nr:DUF58 domain-containing protein [Candidatus Omnitrophota bacterium]